VFSPNQFLDLGNRSRGSRIASVGQGREDSADSRGLYDLPGSNPIIGQTAPDIMATVRALMDAATRDAVHRSLRRERTGDCRTKVPAKVIILTDGVPRRVALGKLDARVPPGRAPESFGRWHAAGLVIQALRYLHAARICPSTLRN